MRIAKAVAAVIVLSIFLTACGKPEAKVLYADEHIRVTRSEGITSVYDVQEGQTYRYRTRRVKRNREDAEAHRAKTLTETPDLYVQTAKGIIVITVKKDLKTIIIPAKSH